MTKTLIVIPARLSSSRLHEKLLKKIHGKEIIVWTSQRVSLCKKDFVVAIDDRKFIPCLEQHKLPYILTSDTHVSGTSRAGEVSNRIPDFDYYCVVQGDEPLIDPLEVSEFIKAAQALEVDYVNAVCCFSEEENVNDTSNVKAVIGKNKQLIYASRAIVPYKFTQKKPIYWQICGQYLFSRSFLSNYNDLAQSELELTENVEQLRCLDLGMTVKTVEVKGPMLSIDTEDDYDRIRKFEKNRFSLGVL